MPYTGYVIILSDCCRAHSHRSSGHVEWLVVLHLPHITAEDGPAEGHTILQAGLDLGILFGGKQKICLEHINFGQVAINTDPPLRQALCEAGMKGKRETFNE